MGNPLVLILEPANVAAGAQEAMEVGVPKAAVGTWELVEVGAPQEVAGAHKAAQAGDGWGGKRRASTCTWASKESWLLVSGNWNGGEVAFMANQISLIIKVCDKWITSET